MFTCGTDRGFKEVPDEEIIKGYEHAKGHQVLVKSEELDELKVEAKQTTHVEELIALTGDYWIARPAYEEAVKRQPGRIVTLRRKRVLADSRNN